MPDIQSERLRQGLSTGFGGWVGASGHGSQFVSEQRMLPERQDRDVVAYFDPERVPRGTMPSMNAASFSQIDARKRTLKYVLRRRARSDVEMKRGNSTGAGLTSPSSPFPQVCFSTHGPSLCV